MWFKGVSLNTGQTWAQIPVLQLTSCVTLGKQSNFSEPLPPPNLDRGSIVIMIMCKAPFSVSLFLGII